MFAHVSNRASHRRESVAYDARMRGGEKTCWRAIQLEAPTTSVGELSPSRQERLAALYRFQNGQQPTDVRFVHVGEHASGTREVTDPAQIDWTHFPVIDAMEAVTRDELRRLRSLLRADAPSEAGAASAPGGLSPTPPNGLVWGVDLRTAALADPSRDA